jgi:hypothetical protein
MKFTTTMGALALGLGLAVVAQAQPDAGYTAIYITGSTAFRGQIFQALNLDMGLTVQNGGTSGQNSFTLEGNITDPHGLGFAKIGDAVEVFCDFSGSAEGVQTIIDNEANSYLSSTAAGGGAFSHNGADFAFSDVGQNSTPFTIALTGVTLPEIQTATDVALGEPYTGFAVVPFTFAVNKPGATAGINNITDANVRDLYSLGTLEEHLFAGTNAAPVYAVGRYLLSGTRITAELDDTDRTSVSLKQYGLGSPSSASTTNVAGYTVPGLNQGDSTTPAGTQWVSLGNGGYFTGGNVGLALAAAVSPLPPAIAYIAWSDAQGKFGSSGAVPITWNGQASYNGTWGSGSWNLAGLENGSYTFYSYERLYENPSDVGTAFDNYGGDLALAIQYEIVHASPQTADLEEHMTTYRASDGADVTHYAGK